jgi:glycosyltransferase involved in cell wall biosynthesis
MTITIAYSSERNGNIGCQVGKLHYSYRFIEDAIIRLLDAAGYDTKLIDSPQNIKHSAAFRYLFGSDPQQVVHICFRSTENIRHLHGVKNICHFAWEFEVMQDSGLLSNSILSNQVHMLNLMDEIWVGCEYTRQVLSNYGLQKTFVVPAPIVDREPRPRSSFTDSLSYIYDVPCVQLFFKGGATREENAGQIAGLVLPLAQTAAMRKIKAGVNDRLFVTIVNPRDLRKNLINMIEGFHMANSVSGGRDTLIIKLAVPSDQNCKGTGLFDALLPLVGRSIAYNDPSVIFVFEYLTDLQIDALLSLSNYYLCASHCEGYNRPLLQAMSFGTVPVTTKNTAMNDYITDANSIIIRERCFLSPIREMAADVAGRPFKLTLATRFEIAAACRLAMNLGEPQYRELSKHARETALLTYGEDRVLMLIKQRLDALTNEVGVQ